MSSERESLTSAPEIAWLIERGQAVNHDPTVWWSGDESVGWGGWTDDANKALRYATRDDAQAFAETRWPTSGRYPDPTYTITEHGWYSSV